MGGGDASDSGKELGNDDGEGRRKGGDKTVGANGSAHDGLCS
jgi:hypothetical protein